MRWQRWARLAVATVGVGCAAAIYFTTRERPVPAAPPAPVDPQAVQQGGRGSLQRSGGDRERRVEYERFATYADGRMRFYKAHLLPGEEQGAEIWADTIDTSPRAQNTDNPPKVELNGNVRIVTADGLDVRTESASFDEASNVVHVPGPMTFSRGRMSGSGVGATYVRGNEQLQIADQARVSMAAEADGTGAMSATARTLTFTRLDKRVFLDQNAQIVQDGDTLSGDTATLRFTDDEKQLRLLELRGRAAVTPGTAPGARPPAMTADDIDLGFHPGGQTLQRATLLGRSKPASMVLADGGGRRSITGSRSAAELAADGTTLTRLDATSPVSVQLPASGDVPAREIRAVELTSRGADKTGLTAARFLGNVEFTESPRAAPGSAPPATGRRVTARALELRLKGQLEAIDTATFQENVIFRDGDKNSGSAERAIYNAAAESLLLRPLTRPSPKVAQAVGDRMTVNAQEIDLDLKKNDLHARMDVTTNTLPKKSDAPGKPATGFFEDDQPLFGAASELHYVGKVATYVGVGETLASLTQGDNQILGAEVKLFTETNNLTADGRVHAKFLLTSGPAPAGGRGAGKPVRYDLTSETMFYDDAKRTATFAGKPAKMTRAEGTTEAVRIVIELAPETRTVQRFNAIGAVFSEEGARSASGDSLQYDARTDHYVLTGSLAKVKMPNTENTGNLKAEECVVTEGQKLEFERQGQPSGYTKSLKKPCDFPIR
jgi:lipopolysaccharide export system protein LptA